MELMILQISRMVMTAIVDASTASPPQYSDKIGFVVLGVILVPVFLLTLVGSIEYPRKSKIPELFVGAFFTLVTTLVVSLAVISFVLKFIVPQ